jgi:hypothetical protein
MLLPFWWFKYPLSYKTHIMIHHSFNKDHGTLVDTQGTRKYHMSYRIDYHIVSKQEYFRRLKIKDGKKFQKPWIDLGYYFTEEYINNQPEILVGRPMNIKGAHCPEGDMNNKAISVCVMGNFDKKKPSDEILIILAKRLVIPLMYLAHIPVEHIVGHRDYAPYKSCPGKKFDLDYFRDLVKRYK